VRSRLSSDSAVYRIPAAAAAQLVEQRLRYRRPMSAHWTYAMVKSAGAATDYRGVWQADSLRGWTPAWSRTEDRVVAPVQ
jgi:hypothetical protein